MRSRVLLCLRRGRFFLMWKMNISTLKKNRRPLKRNRTRDLMQCYFYYLSYIYNFKVIYITFLKVPKVIYITFGFFPAFGRSFGKSYIYNFHKFPAFGRNELFIIILKSYIYNFERNPENFPGLRPE